MYPHFCRQAHQLKDEGKDLMDLVDPRLGMEFDKEEVLLMINVALECTSNCPAASPTMSKVVCKLEGKPIVEVISDDSETMDEIDLEDMRNNHEDKNETPTKTVLSHGTQSSNSKSFSSLYPVSQDSFYRQKTD